MPPKRAKPVKVFDSVSQFKFIVERLPDEQLTLIGRALRRIKWMRRRWYVWQWYEWHLVGAE